MRAAWRTKPGPACTRAGWFTCNGRNSAGQPGPGPGRRVAHRVHTHTYTRATHTHGPRQSGRGVPIAAHCPACIWVIEGGWRFARQGAVRPRSPLAGVMTGRRDLGRSHGKANVARPARLTALPGSRRSVCSWTGRTGACLGLERARQSPAGGYRQAAAAGR